MSPNHAKRPINLALQGGGVHGAFTWGALDRILEEERLEIEAISGTSAGAMNAAMLKTGFLEKGRDGARELLARFWGSLRRTGTAYENPLASWLSLFSEGAARALEAASDQQSYELRDSISRSLSPYDWNPLNLNPLRDLLESLIDFGHVCRERRPHLYISATNVRTGKIKVFSGPKISLEVLLASACLPDMFQAVEIDGEHYWDGGYTGNPALFPLYTSGCRDIVIVHVNPIVRDQLPRSARDIQNRVNEISFNATLLGELRAIAFVRRLIAEGRVGAHEMKDVLVHSIRDDGAMQKFSVVTKLTPDPEVIDELRAAGHAAADKFLRDHWAKLGAEGTVDLRGLIG